MRLVYSGQINQLMRPFLGVYFLTKVQRDSLGEKYSETIVILEHRMSYFFNIRLIVCF